MIEDIQIPPKVFTPFQPMQVQMSLEGKVQAKGSSSDMIYPFLLIFNKKSNPLKKELLFQLLFNITQQMLLYRKLATGTEVPHF
jgi:hypothetical protein